MRLLEFDVYFYSSMNKDYLGWFLNSWVELHYREVRLQCLTWEGHLVSNNSVQSSILLSRAFLQLDLVRTVLHFPLLFLISTAITFLLMIPSYEQLRGGSFRDQALKNSSLVLLCL